MKVDTINTYPDFLTVAFFGDAIANGLDVQPSAIKVLSVQMLEGSKPGENFCSEIYRAVVKYHVEGSAVAEESVSLVVKAMPFTEARGPLLEELQMFDKEVSMYENTLPRISKMLGGLKLNAKYFYSVKTPVEIIVFEDLGASGFKMADRLAGIDENHCSLVLKTLGKLHAASMVLAEEDSQSMDAYWFGIFNQHAPNNAVIKAIFESGLKTVIETATNLPGFEKTVEHMKVLNENFLQKMVRHCNQSTSSYKVLNHGDAWVNNFMFKYDSNGLPTEMVFVDFQLSFYSSPGIDLTYFLNTSPRNELRENRREQLVQTYHSAFVRTLGELQSPMATELTLERTKAEIESRELYGFSAAIGILPIILMVKDETRDSSIDAMTSADSGKNLHELMYNNPAYVKAMQYILRRCDEMHVLKDVAAI